MQVVYKYKIDPNNTLVELPERAQILSVGAQLDDMFLWALVDESAEKSVAKHFCVYGTGHEISHSHLQFIGTVHMYGGDLVFHIFENLGVSNV